MKNKSKEEVEKRLAELLSVPPKVRAEYLRIDFSHAITQREMPFTDVVVLNKKSSCVIMRNMAAEIKRKISLESVKDNVIRVWHLE